MNRHSSERAVDIELLALDLTTCTRCVGTLENIEKAIGAVRPALEATGTRVTVTKRVIASDEQARRHRFVTSPTVRINGRDIVIETLESSCDSCTDLCGCDEGISCRVWPYRGQEYMEAPVGLLVEALLRELAGDSGANAGTSGPYEVPENLRRSFAGKVATMSPDSEPCCVPAELASCCDPVEKAGCCEAPAPTTCGCR